MCEGDIAVAIARRRNIRIILDNTARRIEEKEAKGIDAASERMKQGIALIQLAGVENTIARGQK